MDNTAYVPIRTCQSHEEAAIIQNALSENGITCSLENDHQAGLTGVLAIRILVAADQADQARHFLEEHHAE